MAKKTGNARYAEIVRSRYKKAQDLAQLVFDRVEQNRNLYKGNLQLDDTYEWDYSLVDQQVFPLIRNYISRSNPANTKIRLEARKAEDFERRQINQDFVNWEINELDLSTLLTRGFFSNYVAGRSYFKSGWKYDPRVIVNRDGYEYEMRPLINRADLQFVPFNKILIPNRNIPTIYEQPYVLELQQIRIGDMLKDNESYGYEYWDKAWIEKMRKGGLTSKQLDYEAEFVKDADTMDEMTFNAATFPAVCMHTLEGDELYIPLIDDMDVILNKNQENRYWHGKYPYIEQVAFPEDDEYYSMSVVDAVGDTQIASTEVLNQTLTNIRSLNNNMYVAGADAANVPDWQFKQRPSGIIRVAGDPNSIVPLSQKDGTMSMLRMGQELQTKFERTGGISSLYSSGSASTKSVNQTARGAQIIDQNIETNIQMIMDLFGEQVLKHVGDHFLALNSQFVTEEQTFSITGKRGVRELIMISPDQTTANFDVYSMPESMIKQSPASRQASLQNLITVLNTQVTPAGVQVDLVPIAENLLDSYPEMDNIEDVVVAIDEKGERDALMLSRGQMPEIKSRDPHLELIQIVSIFYEDHMMELPPEVQQLFTQYAEKHLRYIQSEQEIMMLAQPQLPGAVGVDPMMQAMAGEQVNPETMGTGDEGYNLGEIGNPSVG